MLKLLTVIFATSGLYNFVEKVSDEQKRAEMRETAVNYAVTAYTEFELAKNSFQKTLKSHYERMSEEKKQNADEPKESL